MGNFLIRCFIEKPACKPGFNLFPALVLIYNIATNVSSAHLSNNLVEPLSLPFNKNLSRVWTQQIHRGVSIPKNREKTNKQTKTTAGFEIEVGVDHMR